MHLSLSSLEDLLLWPIHQFESMTGYSFTLESYELIKISNIYEIILSCLNQYNTQIVAEICWFIATTNLTQFYYFLNSFFEKSRKWTQTQVLSLNDIFQDGFPWRLLTPTLVTNILETPLKNKKVNFSLKNLIWQIIRHMRIGVWWSCCIKTNRIIRMNEIVYAHYSYWPNMRTWNFFFKVVFKNKNKKKIFL